MAGVYERWVAGVVVGIHALLGSGCADNETTVFIRNVIVPNQDCSVTPDPGGLFYPTGFLDAAFARRYHASLLVGNSLVPRGDDNRLRTETSRVRLERAEVRVLDANEAPVSRTDGSAAAFSVPIAGFIEPGGAGEPGFGIASVVLLDDATVDSLAAQLKTSGGIQTLLTEVRVMGTSLGGVEVETPPFRFPIDVCFGCLVSFPPSADDPTIDGPDCRAPAEAATNPVCRVGQDTSFSCQLCQGNPLCEP